MKKTILVKIIILTFILTSVKIFAQPTWTCGTTGAGSLMSVSSPTSPIGCQAFLDGFVPHSTDSVSIVKVRMTVFTPTSGVGTWDAANNARALNAIRIVDSIYSHISVNTLSVPSSVAYIPDTRIRFVLDGSLNVISDQATYENIQLAVSNPSYMDPSVINVFYGAAWYNGVDSLNNPVYWDVPNVSPPLPNNTIFFPLGKPGFPITRDFGNDTVAGVLAHELGHALGLMEATYSFGWLFHGASYIMPPNGCCWIIGVSDYVLENPPFWAPCGTSGGSNNMMSENIGCHKYFSPRQMAVMHYNLKTEFKNMLTSQGYDNATKVNHNFDYNITAAETWTVDRYMKGDIIVKAGKTLTVKCNLGMTRGAKILVEKTALLVVDGGTITNISGSTWDGIHVVGDPNQSQAIVSGMPQYQGMAKFINGAEISHAKIGVKNHVNTYSQFGGIIFASNSNFLNNRIDVEIVGSNGSASIATSVSKFYSCNFKTTDLIGDNLYPLIHVNLYKSVGVWFHGCNFEYAAGTSMPYWPNVGCGIKSVNSKFTADLNVSTPSTFKNLLRGVDVNNYNPLRVPTIANCVFTDNLEYGAYFMNANYLNFRYNTIQNSVQSSIPIGVYLNNCKYYTIQNNSFLEDLNYNYKMSPGLEIYNSTTGAHQVYRNSFSNLLVGINAMGNNSGISNFNDGLKMNCNNFTQTNNAYDIALDLGMGSTAPSVMQDQGNISNANATNVVRNMYAATCTNTDENKWYIHNSSNKQVNHGCNATSINGESTKPTPQPSCSRSIVNIVTISAPLDYVAACGSGPPSSGGTSTISYNRLASMNDYLATLKQDELDYGVSHHFEIQATVASKLNLFLTDTVLANPDSVLVILENNHGAMEDADLQTVFAYMDLGDYTTALDKVSALTGSRSDWADLLEKLIEADQDSTGGKSVVEGSGSFFYDYAATVNGDGQSIAQALLQAACDSSYTEPHNYPESVSTERKMYADPKVDKASILNEKAGVEVYPNPAQNGITIHYSSTIKAKVKIELRDLLGRLIYTNFIYEPVSNHYIPLNDLNSGMYLLTLSNKEEVIFKTKIIKVDSN